MASLRDVSRPSCTWRIVTANSAALVLLDDYRHPSSLYFAIKRIL